MRFFERAFELNFCAQFSERVSSKRTLWFGLTQQQEAQWGFDARSRFGGLCLIFQFKVLERKTEGLWRFRAPHQQLCKLQAFAQEHARDLDGMFYAFPLISSQEELEHHVQLLPKTWLLDVYALRSIPRPPGKDPTHTIEFRLEETKRPEAYMAAIGQNLPLYCVEELVHDLQEGRLIRHADAVLAKARSIQAHEAGDQIRLPLGGVVLW